MSPRLGTLPLLVLVALGLGACSVQTDGSDPSTSVFADADDAAQLAQDLAWDHLARTPRLLDGVDRLLPGRVRFDQRGQAHVAFQQTQDGVAVWGGELILHLGLDGQVFHQTDALVRNLGVDTTPAWTADEAIDLATAAPGVVSDLTEGVRTDLWILPTASGPALTWRVQLQDIDDTDAPSMPVLFIDAHDGQVRLQYENLQTYALSDDDHVTYDMDEGTRYSSADVGDSSDSELLTTYDASVATFDYLADAFGRESYDDRGSQARSYGHYSRNYSNAFWSGNRAVFGDGNGSSYLYYGSLDVTAHEFGHGVTQYEANLQYSNESGALNEASSDILGAVVQAYVEGGTSDAVWDLGEDVRAGSGAIRYMDEPSNDGYSRDHYSNRYTGSGDSGGVHYNSGIANHFFYLLTEGGQHHRATYRSGYTVEGIGIDDAYAIWYTALSGYMTRTTNFSGARTATQDACEALSFSEAQCHSVSLAWYEVGVGSDPGDYPSDPVDTGDTGGTGDGGAGDGGAGDGGAGDGGSDGGTSDGGAGDGGGDGGAPDLDCTGGTLYAGSLSGTGDTATEPDSGVAFFPSGLTVTLAGTAGTDFDLGLYQRRGSSSVLVRTSATSGTSDESIAHPRPGGYIFEVSSASGAGDYLLCVE